MGVNLTGIVPRKEIDFDFLRNKSVAIDAFNAIYQFLSSIRGADGSHLMDSEGRITSHLQGLFSRNLNLMGKGINLVYVFDGEPPKLKFKERLARAERKQLAEEKYKEALSEKDLDEMYKYSKQFTRMDESIINESKELISAMGIPVVQAPSEAEGQAAYMCKNGVVDFAASQDYDSLLFGAPKLVRNLTLSQKRKVYGKIVYIFLELIELKNVLEELKLNQEQMIVLGILTGSVDYSELTLIKDPEGMKLVRIGELYDNIQSGKQSQDIFVPCFNLDNGDITFKKVKKFIKHDLTESLFEVKTDYGRVVKVTGSHSLFTFKDNKVVPIKTTKLKIKDKILIPIKIPCINYPQIELNIADLLYPYVKEIKTNLSIDGLSVIKILKSRLSKKGTVLTDKRLSLTKAGSQALIGARKSFGITQNNCVVSETAVYSWEKGRCAPTIGLFSKHLESLGFDPLAFVSDVNYVDGIIPSIVEETIDLQMGSNLKYRKTFKFKDLSKEEISLLEISDKIYSRRETGIPIKISLNKDFIKIIGYYLAEGNPNNSYRLSFSFNYTGEGHDDFCVDELKQAIKSVFNLDVNIYNEKSGRHICLDNSVVKNLFVLGLKLGTNSKNKSLPYFVYNLSEEYKLELLKTLFLGDGSLDSTFISFNTSSKDLAEGISYILLQLGFVSSISLDKTGMYRLAVCGKEQLLRLKSVWENHHNSKSLLDYLVTKKRKRSKFIPFGDLGIVEIVYIKEIKSSNKSVFDFSVDGENFIAGLGGICCHNTDFNPGGVKGIGPKKALKLIGENKTFKDFDKIFEKLEVNFDWREVYDIFVNLPVEEKINLKWKNINEEKIIKLLVDKYEFNLERVSNLIEKYKNENKNSNQKGLGEFF